MKRRLLLGVLGTMLLGLAVATPASAQPRRYAGPTILDQLYAANRHSGEFTTLLVALECTGLDLVLGDPYSGTFTLLAPTNAAFAADGLYPEDILDLCYEDPELLRDILLYHVVPGQRSLQTLYRQRYVPTLLDGFSVYVTAGYIHRTLVFYVDDARFIPHAVLAYNGAIHKIDRVLFPFVAVPAS